MPGKRWNTTQENIETVSNKDKEYTIKATQPSYEKRINKFVRLPNVPFRVLVIPGYTIVPNEDFQNKKFRGDLNPRHEKMEPTSTEWENIWTHPQPFNHHIVPLPIYQGFIKNTKLNIPPNKYANAEILKVQNFLHLTPRHVDSQCKLLKKFCTPWPKGLSDDAIEKHFPVKVSYSNFCHSSPSIRHDKSSNVSVQFKLHSLSFNQSARDKIIYLLGQRYNKDNDTVSLFSDRCPTKKQNYDYLIYLMNVLIRESHKLAPFEKLKSEDDELEYKWELTKSKNIIEKYIDNLDTSKTEKDKMLKSYQNASQSIRDNLNDDTMQEYKIATMNLLYCKNK
ncbi:28S ribosomal protein S35, mitochondrial [Intoshia linei]|uniref:28S ribosomal protein S35, mitochondrial n=1 Tax=Intoshia linei TaxID=1819745 RepID=A0A177B7M7_9BILA|nr:28S ribosomal protein S35, mitochondrial [Intoshia linei]